MPQPQAAPQTPRDPKTEIRKLRACLQSVDFLYHLKLDELDLLMGAMKVRKYPAGFTVITQGDKGDAFYLISSGKVSVWNKKDQLSTLYPGSFFGESALVNDIPRSATVKTDTEAELYILYKDDFNRILMHNPAIAAAIKAHITQLKFGKK
jgi:CRP-like cAMP-binding protein